MHNSIFDNLKKAEQGAKLSILSYLFLTILKLGAGLSSVLLQLLLME